MKMLLWYRRLQREARQAAMMAVSTGNMPEAKAYINGVEALDRHYAEARIALVNWIGYVGVKNFRTLP